MRKTHSPAPAPKPPGGAPSGDMPAAAPASGALFMASVPSSVVAEAKCSPEPASMETERPGDDAKPRNRILVVSQHFWPENFRINDIVSGFTAGGLEVDVLCGLPNYPAGEWFPDYRYTGPRRESHAGAQVFRAGEIRRKGNTGLRIFLNYVSFPFFALFSLPRLHGRKYDAVFCFETSPVMMLLPAILYAKTHRLPLTAYVLDLWPDNLYSVLPVKNKALRRLAQAVSNWHYRRCDRLIAMSDALAQRLNQIVAGRKKPAEITVIPQYGEDFYAEDVHDEALAAQFAGGFNILFTGNFSPAQDLENLIRALKLARAAGHNEVRALLLGDGMSRPALEALVETEGLADAVRFCGQVPPRDIPRWTGFADALFCGLAVSENLGLTVPGKLPGYFAAGRPLLVATGGEGERAAQESGAALVSPPGDSAALAENILALLAMPPARRAQMGQNGRAYYRAHHRRDALLARLRDFTLNGTGGLVSGG